MTPTYRALIIILLAGVSVAHGLDLANAKQSAAERELLSLEAEWAQVDVTNDRSVFERILAPDFVSTSRSGKFLNRQEWLAHWEYEGVPQAMNTEMRVHLVANDVAVVTGIDTTSGTDSAGKPWTHSDRFTDTWVKRGGAWQCVAAQVTRIR